ncbi:hypothetical protein MMC27_008729 [Xylographa pallens]|nr:hypothetical protein [Xylographa pallens]
MNAVYGIFKGGELNQRTGKLMGPILLSGETEDITHKHTTERLGMGMYFRMILLSSFTKVQPKYWYSSTYKNFVLHLTEIIAEYRGIPKPQTRTIGRTRKGYQYSHHDTAGGALVKSGERDLPSAIQSDTKWYYTSAKDMKVKVRLEDIVGRVYEQEADRAWYGRTQTPYYYRDRTSVLEERWWARNNDPRIASDDGQDFFWASTHIEELGIESLTHLPVGYIDGEWNTVRYHLRIRSPRESEGEKKDYLLVMGRDHAVYFNHRGVSCGPLRARGKTWG